MEPVSGEHTTFAWIFVLQNAYLDVTLLWELKAF